MLKYSSERAFISDELDFLQSSTGEHLNLRSNTTRRIIFLLNWKL